ncbi:hypothetical protein FRACYDRAFT_267493 [Fragilariopsis cylindrus CCMP1102]|uniref:Uncharacterized protein n=1 Tax=Fragilariopsis cylindrus CCMP1102 TaxID=635003 RepID=A0A1E7FYP8_9STRA|nr:hypothetical protein FRACYDRAFT_267493 [Fragilariopsis cylindrus CCMP1102]|eukprot:OEU23277.1 hypothetical protein FRACYDRAFT_267493 [Fragilariopsis cylindrus CCMP1102]
MNGDSGDIIIEDHHRAAMDNKYLQIFIRLRQMGLFKKEDIQRHELLIELVSKDYHFEEKRLRFLVEWDPSALLQPNSNGYLPIHFAAVSIRKLQLVFEYGIRYYPKKTGICLLFKKVDDDVTPFQEACERYGCDRVRNAVKDTLRDCQRRRSEEDNSNSTSGPYNIADALITAAIDETIHLDCVYFLLRREPDILHKLLSSKHTAAAISTAMVESDNINIDEGASDRLTSATKINPKKRKRSDRQNHNNNNNDDDDDFI